MTWILIQLMKHRIYKAKKKQLKHNSILKQAYSTMIKNYKDTIMFLQAE